MAQRGEDTIRFGPMKPVGLTDPRTGREPYACVQLRQDNHSASLYSLVGFQTRLKFNEQQRVFRKIPGLEHAEFVRYGVMHRNTYLKSPGFINSCYQSRQNPGLFFAGQITGVEGYVESVSSGLVAGINAALYVLGCDETLDLPSTTVTGALAHYISDSRVSNFQPMNANFGIVDPIGRKIRKKEEKNREIAARSLDTVDKSRQFLQDLIKSP
jgi:methylenetetrahydrofolate--tRNA-(uracil-5-)-methyltransferase